MCPVIEGSLTVWRADQPDRIGTVDLKGGTVTPKPSDQGNQLTVLPGGSVSIAVSWRSMVYSTVSGDSTPVWEGMPATPVTIYDQVSGKYVTVLRTDGVFLVARASVRVFAGTGLTESPDVRQTVYYDIWP